MLDALAGTLKQPPMLMPAGHGTLTLLTAVKNARILVMRMSVKASALVLPGVKVNNQNPHALPAPPALLMDPSPQEGKLVT